MSTISPADYLGNVTFCVVDVETTGLSVNSGHRICEIAMLRYRGGEVLGTFETLVNPQRSISAGASSVNNLTDWHVASAPVFSQVAERVNEMMSDAVLVAHNAPFDLDFLANEWRRLRRPPRRGFAVDTLALARRMYAFRSNRLGAVAQSLRVRVDRQHRAMGDVWTNLRVLEVMLADLNREDVVILADLLDAQGGNVPWPERELLELPPTLELAMAEGRRLWLRYRSQSGLISERWVEPLDVVGDERVSYLAAYCTLRGEERNFRMDRILAMRLDDEEVSGD
ncbi:MAG: exonuclease domain-containing protein [Chloroflexota bacterium]|nr:exonuclease domain-containing protein [Chloroflexota bacterium]